MAASTDSGIRFRMLGTRITDTSSKTPCTMAASLVRPPDWMLAELRTMTCVTGRPPIRPEKMLPVPWAISSRLVGVTRRRGSSLSVASTQSSVSRLATRAMVKPVSHTDGMVTALKSGKLNCPMKSSKLSGTGTLTRCSGEMPRPPLPIVISQMIPAATATSGPGMILKTLLFFSSTASHRIRIPSAMKAMVVAPSSV